ncbi:MAG: hypothetical protein Q8881_03420, partial [Sweet potato little leaf phytoplasma]|nr:hypothetical protein [Sweet potato little leaf phytoplasma]
IGAKVSVAGEQEIGVVTRIDIQNKIVCVLFKKMINPAEFPPNFALRDVSDETAELPPNFALGDLSHERAEFPPNFALGDVSPETAEFSPNFPL